MKNLPEGQYIKHFQYGCGVITESDSERTTIDFDLHEFASHSRGVKTVPYLKRQAILEN